MKWVLVVLVMTFVMSFVLSPTPINPALSDEIVGLKIIHAKDNVYQFEMIRIGWDQQFQNFTYDTESENTFIGGDMCAQCNQTLNVSKSKTLQKLNKNIKQAYSALDFIVEGECYSDNFSLDFSSKEVALNFIIAKSLQPEGSQYNNSGVLGFGYRYDANPEGRNASIIDLIIQEYKLPERVFIQETDGSVGKIFVGGVPRRIIDNSGHNETFCKIPEGATKWSCEISTIIAEERFNFSKALQYGSNTSIAIFSTMEPFIRAPYSAKKHFEKHFFSDLECNITEVRIGFQTFNCSKNDSIYKGFKAIIDGYAYSLPQSSLFTESANYMIFNIHFHKTISSDNSWVFGQIFLKDYQVEFNSDKKRMGFYGGERRVTISAPTSEVAIQEESGIILKMVIALVALVLIVSAICIFRYYRKQQNEKMFNIVGDQVFLRNSRILNS